MRIPHNPEPALNLGDDPDPAAEIGSRLAAGSQTAQGLLTNYLFYGQRRTAQGDNQQRQAVTRAQSDDRDQQESDVARANALALTVRSARRGPGRGGVATDGEQRSRRLVRVPDGTPRLRFIRWRAEERTATNSASKASLSSSPGPDPDALAVDLFADDPLSRDPLVSPLGQPAQGPTEPRPARRRL